MDNSVESNKIADKEKKIIHVLIWGSLAGLFLILVSFMGEPYFLGLLVLFIMFGFLILAVIYLVVIHRKTILRWRGSAKDLFETLSYEKTLFRYNLLYKYRKDALKIFIMISIISSILLYAIYQFGSTDENNKIMITNFFLSIISISAMVLYSLHVSVNRFYNWYDFDFFFCKGCFKILKENPNILEIPKSYLILGGLRSYSYFLSIYLKKHINNPEIFYLKILSDSDKSMKSIVEEINQALNEEDKLQFLRYLTKLYDKSKPDFLSKDRTSKKFIEIIAIILAPSVTVALFLISYFINSDLTSFFK